MRVPGQAGLIGARSDVFALERVDAYYLRTERLFDRLLGESFPRYLWARSVPRRIKRAGALLARVRDSLYHRPSHRS